MFYPHLIIGISPGDRVLEVGPGGMPHRRADVLLEYDFADPGEALAQRGYAKAPRTSKQMVYYTGNRFPFDDNAFDYVICSHVIEHVPDVETFVAELFRVAPRGYLEYPTILYEYLYNFGHHVNYVKRVGDALVYLPKHSRPLDGFAPIQRRFRDALDVGHDAMILNLKPFMIEGFEWREPFPVRRTDDVGELVAAGPIRSPTPYYALRSWAARSAKSAVRKLRGRP